MALLKSNRFLLIIFCIVFILNCFSAEKKYTLARKYYNIQENKFVSHEGQFSEGEPYWLIDNLGHLFFSLPAKLLLWNWDFGNHKISQETKEITKQYFIDNGIDDVKVRFNEYAPIDELVRLWNNKKVNPLVRIFPGLPIWIIKTLFPERLFAGFGILFLGGGDYYDPYTNSIHIFSDSVPIALHESGHAKDFATTRNTTSYALMRIIPFTSLYQEGYASQDAVQYLRYKCKLKNEAEAYKQLPPAYATYIASIFGTNVVYFALPGHMVSLDLREKFRKSDVPECGKIFGKQNQIK